MGFVSGQVNSSESHSSLHAYKFFLLCNYILLGASSSCIFLTLSLRLVPSFCGFSIILLHAFTIAGAVTGCAEAARKGRWYTAHMIMTVLTAIFQGSVAVLIFTRTGDFLQNLKSYVREEDGMVILKLAGGLCVLIFTRTGDFLQNLKSYVREEDGMVILKLAGGLCVLIFCLEWVGLGLAFVLRYYAFVEGEVGSGSIRRTAKVQEDELNGWARPFQV